MAERIRYSCSSDHSYVTKSVSTITQFKRMMSFTSDSCQLWSLRKSNFSYHHGSKRSNSIEYIDPGDKKTSTTHYNKTLASPTSHKICREVFSQYKGKSMKDVKNIIPKNMWSVYKNANTIMIGKANSCQQKALGYLGRVGFFCENWEKVFFSKNR